MLQQAIAAPPPMYQGIPDKLEQIHTILVELGIESSLVRSFMAMLSVILPGVPNVPSVPVASAVSISADILPVASVIEKPVILQAIAPPPVLEEQPALKLIVATQPEIAKPAPLPFDLSLFAAPRPQPRFSAAELAFMSSVSSPKEQGA
jgi:hypothetical protein